MRSIPDTLAGVLLALLAVALFTPVYAAGKFTDLAVPAVAIMWMRYIGGVTTIAVVVVATRTPLAGLASPAPWMHLGRVLLGAGGGICAVHAASVMPVADAAAIGLTQGMMIVALAALLLRERVGLGHWLAGGLSALGAWLVIRALADGAEPGDRSLEGAAAAFVGAFLLSCEVLLLKVLARRETALGVLVHVNGMAAVVFAIPAVLAARSAGLTAGDLAPFLVLGPLAITAQFCNILAFRRADAAILGPIGYSWILFSALLGYVCFGEVPAPGAALGAALIVTGGVWLTAVSMRPARAGCGRSQFGVPPPGT